MTVHWDDKLQCVLELPAVLPNTGTTNLLLPCHLPGSAK
jgi:hypothetical protein